MGLSKKSMRPVTDLDRYKSSLKDREVRKQMGGEDDDAKKRTARRRRVCPLKDEKMICRRSREVARFGDKIIPFLCVATGEGFELCTFYNEWRKEQHV